MIKSDFYEITGKIYKFFILFFWRRWDEELRLDAEKIHLAHEIAVSNKRFVNYYQTNNNNS